ncbi:CDP-glycerol--poly(glycerophosphate) glycerophosphotransferase [Pediococcus ethanolidurans]|uniref:CDP-glycerol glycerophosphotransferase family protein n=1 Tax=Pediococcus ethanolidurans TaxID=319653 RepID=UPI00295319E9|nr:CDP-glycerol glycerophosphotransferase family protein [Pediococcus ethanolidurans]MDV7718987.1 CDP-glycerol--poly(glycerophosphate) glycerophosphotransferase [Pediococcus ethanolidurans]
MRHLLRRIRNKLHRILHPTPANTVTPEETQPTYHSPRLVENIDSLIKRRVNSIDFNGAYFTISGIAYFEKFPEKDEEKIVKSLILAKDGVDDIEIPLVNQTSEDPRFPMAGYTGTANFSVINKGKPLEPGQYEIKIQLKQYLSDGWLIERTSVGKILDCAHDLSYITNMTSYSAKKNTQYRLIFKYNFAANSLEAGSNILSEINPLENELDTEFVLESPVMRTLKRRVLKLAYNWYHLLPVDRHKISFVSDSRTSISGNFEFIYQELLKRKTNFKISFYLKPSIKAKKSWHEIFVLAKAFATSRYILLDDFYPMIYPLTIRHNADLIQVWHAVGAFKTFGYSRVGMPGGPKLDSLNHKNYTKALVSSKHVADKYAEGFDIPEKNIVTTGIPRTDVFFDKTYQANVRQKLQEELPFIKGKKVILFAPTFRGNGQQSAYYPFEDINFNKIYEALHKDYVFLLKIHPFVQNEANIPYKYADFFHDVSDYREINDLLMIADELITDYSSVCFEYALLKRPMIFFAPDLTDYMQKRSFYFNYLDFIPGTLAENTDELIKKIQEPQMNRQKLDSFVNYFFDQPDGHATERFVDKLENEFKNDDDQNSQNEDPDHTPDGKVIPHWGKHA